MRRRLALGFLVVVAAVAALALLVHAPFVRRAVLRYAISTVEQQYGLRVTADRLDYNLFSLRIGLAGVRASAVLPADAGSQVAQPPFFEADYVSVLIPRRTLTGDVFVDDLSVRNGVIRIVRTADGRTNLPAARETAPGEPAPLPIGRFAAAPLRVEVTDEMSALALAIPNVSVALAADAGRIALGAPAALRVGSHGTTFAQVAGDARFDGRTLRVANLQVDADEGRVRVDGAFAIVAREPSLDLRLTGTGDVARLARWGMAEGEVPRGEVAFSGQVSGAIAAPRATVEARSPRLAWQQVTLTNASARARVSPERLEVERLDADLPGGHVSGSLAMPLAADGGLTVMDRLRADAVVTLTNRRPFFSPVPLPGESRLEIAQGAWTLEGRHRLGGVAPAIVSLLGRVGRTDLMRTTVVGRVRVLDTDVGALLAALRGAGLADVPADAAPGGIVSAHVGISGTLARTVVTVDAISDSLRLTTPAVSGPATVMATYDTQTERYTFEGVYAGQLAASTDLPVTGYVDTSFRGSGRGAAVTASADLAGRALGWEETFIGDITARVLLEGEQATVVADAPGLPAHVDAIVATTAPYAATVEARAERVDLAQFIRGIETPVPLSGTASVTARATGPLADWRRASARVEVGALDASAGGLPVHLREPAVVRYEDERVFVDRAEADAGETRVSAFGSIAAFEGASADGLIVTVTGDVGEVARTVAALGLTEVPVTGGSGPVALLARVTGSLATPDISADLEVGPGAVTLEALPAISGVRLRTHVEDGWLELREAQATYQGAALTATGRMPLALLGVGDVVGIGAPGDASLRARATGVTAAVLQPFVDAGAVQELSGSIDASLEIDSPSLDLEAVRGALTLDRLDLRVANLPVTQRVPTRIVAGDGFARVEAWDWTGEGATLGVAGQVRLSDRQAAILANGEVDLRMLTPFVRDAGLATTGTLRPRLSITGDIADPRVDGDLLLADAEMRMVDPRILVSELNGRAVLTRSSATITALVGSVNGGALSAEGTAALGAGGAVDAQLAATIRGMALEFPAGLRSELDAALQLAVALPAEAGTRAESTAPIARLTGTVTMLRGSYREPLAVVTGLLANVRAASTTPGGGSDALDALALDVRLQTDEDILVDNNYGRFALGADLRLIGTAAAPALSGRAELREGGQLFVGRNVYDITSGTIDFANPLAIEPNMNLVLATRAGGEDIEVTVTGTPDTASVVLSSSSDSSLGQADLTALLLTGRRIDQLASADAALLGAQVLGNFSAEVLGFAGRAIGLDTLRLGAAQTIDSAGDPAVLATDLDPTSRLTFGKTFGSDLDVTFSQSLRDGDAQTWIVEWLPSRRIQLRLVSDDEDLLSYGFRHDLTFGGPPRQVTSAADRRPESRVASITVAGEQAIPEERVRALLSLESGDRFDFADWQRDRDRILALYQGEGYLTARVNATRSEGPEVALTYTIMPGPRAAIVVTGMMAPASLLDELRRTWTEAVYDTFLVEEAEQVVRRALARDGYLQPAVAAAVAHDAGRATLTVSVEPGTQTTATQVCIDGADAALTERLMDVVADEGLAPRAIAEPGAVEGALTLALRREGYARSRVTVGAPLFEGASATVPVTVMAGPALVFGPVGLDGVSRLPMDDVRGAAALPEGDAADLALVDAAQERIVALYRAEGFTRAAVVATQQVRTEQSRLDVTFAVTEGARQVLSDVVIDGNRGIDTDVIERALRLERGQPLRAGDWLQARTRVFDTGLFRRVDVAPEVLAEGTTAETLPVRMQVTVEEWPALRARYGLQLEEERPEDNVQGRDLVPGLSGDVTRRTLFGRAVTVGAAAALERRERLGRMFVNAPTMLGLPVRSSFIVERARRDFAAATLVTDTSSVAWEQRVRPSPRLNLSYVYRFERNHTFDTQPRPGDIPFDILVDVARLTGSAAWDTRDDPSDTTQGALLSSSIELAAQRIASDISYVRSLSQAYYFRPWRDLVFASAARAGVVQPLAGQELIPSVRFYAGGARTVRGVDEDSLGERNFFGDPVGGESLLVFNQEVRFPIYRWLRGVGFLDMGGVFAEPGFSFGEMTTSAGFGLRLSTPFGVLRADYGRAVTSVPEDGSGRFTFGIGQAF